MRPGTLGPNAELEGVLTHPSPNHGPRRGVAQPDLIVLHFTAMDGAEEALARLCDPGPEVSAHWLIGRDGRLWRLVPDARRAWHAGRGAWGGVEDVNSHSIGIEIDNDGRSPFSEPAMAQLEHVLRDAMARYSIPPERVIGHSDMAPGRKADPGARFDWDRLARLGLAVPRPRLGRPTEAAPIAPDRLDTALRTLGYTAVAPFAARLDAFRLRFHPEGRGPAGPADLAIAETLARDYPVDRPARRG